MKRVSTRILTGRSGGIAFFAVIAVMKLRRASLVSSPSSNIEAMLRVIGRGLFSGQYEAQRNASLGNTIDN
jgi:hypothetical protein